MSVREISNREDVFLLVSTFYDKIKKDDFIGPIFLEAIPNKEWENHLEKLTDFWETNLFFAKKYKGNPMQVHQKLDVLCHTLQDLSNSTLPIAIGGKRNAPHALARAEEVLTISCNSVADVVIFAYAPQFLGFIGVGIHEPLVAVASLGPNAKLRGQLVQSAYRPRKCPPPIALGRLRDDVIINLLFFGGLCSVVCFIACVNTDVILVVIYRSLLKELLRGPRCPEGVL